MFLPPSVLIWRQAISTGTGLVLHLPCQPALMPCVRQFALFCWVTCAFSHPLPPGLLCPACSSLGHNFQDLCVSFAECESRQKRETAQLTRTGHSQHLLIGACRQKRDGERHKRKRDKHQAQPADLEQAPRELPAPTLAGPAVRSHAHELNNDTVASPSKRIKQEVEPTVKVWPVYAGSQHDLVVGMAVCTCALPLWHGSMSSRRECVRRSKGVASSLFNMSSWASASFDHCLAAFSQCHMLCESWYRGLRLVMLTHQAVPVKS